MQPRAISLRRLFAPEFQESNPSIMSELRAAFLKTDTEVFQEACQALATLDLTDNVTKLDTPTLVLVGEQDEATPVPMSIELEALLPDAQLRIFELNRAEFVGGPMNNP